jgi:hypothetical protein
MMTCAYAFIQSDERNIAIAHISKLFLNFHFYNFFLILRLAKIFYNCPFHDLDERFTWEKHIYNICAKVGAGIGIMRRMKPFVPVETLKLIYNALVQPYFDYCSPLWDNCGSGLREKLQRIKDCRIALREL